MSFEGHFKVIWVIFNALNRFFMKKKRIIKVRRQRVQYLLNIFHDRHCGEVFLWSQGYFKVIKAHFKLIWGHFLSFFNDFSAHMPTFSSPFKEEGKGGMDIGFLKQH